MNKKRISVNRVRNNRITTVWKQNPLVKILDTRDIAFQQYLLGLRSWSFSRHLLKSSWNKTGQAFTRSNNTCSFPEVATSATQLLSATRENAAMISDFFPDVSRLIPAVKYFNHQRVSPYLFQFFHSVTSIDIYRIFARICVYKLLELVKRDVYIRNLINTQREFQLHDVERGYM